MPLATLLWNQPAGEGLRLLTFDIVLPGYTIPGQYLSATVGDLKPAWFAITSSPGEPVQLLVKASGPAAEALAALLPGDDARLSDPTGKGFDLAPTEGRELVILATGSGISAVRPVIRAELASGLPRPVTLLYGVLSTRHRSFLADLEAWGNAGVKVHTVVGGDEVADWDGATGFVQDEAERRGLLRDDVALVLCGLPSMLEQVKEIATIIGIPDDCVVTNLG